MESPSQTSKIPRAFINGFLKCRGRKVIGIMDCLTCGAIASDEEIHRHPLRWLWDHASKGHAPGFVACFGWDRQIGRSGYFEEWARTWLYRFYGGHFELIEEETFKDDALVEENVWKRIVREQKEREARAS